MTAALILPVEQWKVLEQGWLWLRAERVREYRPHVPWSVDKRERLVSPTVSENLLPKPCPAPGVRVGDPGVKPCESCGGSGLVAEPFLVGTTMARTTRGGLRKVESRDTKTVQALLAEVRLTGQPIPVVKMVGPWTETFPCIEVLDGSHPTMCTIEGDQLVQRFMEEPWAQGLAVGDLLARIDVTTLDQPVLDKPCSTCDGRGLGRNRSHDGKPIDVPCWSCGGGGRVPLSLVPGTWEDITWTR